MKKSIDELRRCHILPNENLDECSKREVKGLEIISSSPNNPWWKNDYLVHFDEKPLQDDSKKMNDICHKCKGQCCYNLPDHQIRIYATEHEMEKIVENGFEKKVEETVNLNGTNFHVLSVNNDVKELGNCSYLTPTGCSLGELRPLWCKMFYCEKVFGGEYKWEKEKTKK